MPFGSYGGSRSHGVQKSMDKPSRSASDMKPFKKDFYKEHANVAAMTPQEVTALRTTLNVSVSKGRHSNDTASLPNPLRSFEEAGFGDQILADIKKAGFAEPSNIQAQGWPIALSGKDMIGIADTGSGKTLSFMLPAIIHCNSQEYLQYGEGPICLILAPTRELVVQIQQEAVKFGGACRSVNLVGGMPKGPQIREMRAGREIVVATPGRLIDLIDMGIFNLNRTTFFCLDEADRMLDMGFEKPLRQISGMIRSDRQTLMFSATWPRSVQSLAQELCKEDPVHVTIGSAELKANTRVSQCVEVLESHSHDTKKQKIFTLLEEHLKPAGAKAIIFCKTKRECDNLSYALKREGGIYALPIHGDKLQSERDWTLDEFRKGTHPVLVATDVAARGLDVKGVTCVINYDFPMNVEDYVHRIGRTGRAGTYGSSHTFFVASDLKNASRSARDLIGILKEAKQEIPEKLSAVAYSGGKGGRGGYGGGKGYGKGKGKGYGGGYGKRY